MLSFPNSDTATSGSIIPLFCVIHFGDTSKSVRLPNLGLEGLGRHEMDPISDRVIFALAVEIITWSRVYKVSILYNIIWSYYRSHGNLINPYAVRGHKLGSSLLVPLGFRFQ